MPPPSFTNICCWQRNRPRGPCNEIRFVELILCTVCIGLTFLFALNGVVAVPIFLTLFCMIGFIFILVVDIIVITAWFPIGWRAWILISLSASLYYFTCTGLSFVVDHPLYLLGTCMYFITAVVFLFDTLCIIWLVRLNPETGIGPRICPTACKASQVTPLPRQYDPLYMQSLRDQTTQTGIVASSRLSDNRSIKWQGSPASYGGTFHMSRDTAPMPGPQPMTTQNVYAPDLRERRSGDTETYESFQMYEDEPMRGNRTVAVMTKIKPKQTQDVDLTPLQSPFCPEDACQPPCRPPPNTKCRRKFPPGGSGGGGSGKGKFFSCKPRSHGTSSTNSPRSLHSDDGEYSSPRVHRQFISRK